MNMYRGFYLVLWLCGILLVLSGQVLIGAMMLLVLTLGEWESN